MQDFYNFSETVSKSLCEPGVFSLRQSVEIFLNRRERKERFMRKSVVINNLRGYNNLYADL
jgi:hypothetical protein